MTALPRAALGASPPHSQRAALRTGKARRHRAALLSVTVVPPNPLASSLWQLFLDDRRALPLKWGLVILLLVLAALLDVPL